MRRDCSSNKSGQEWDLEIIKESDLLFEDLLTKDGVARSQRDFDLLMFDRRISESLRRA